MKRNIKNIARKIFFGPLFLLVCIPFISFTSTSSYGFTQKDNSFENTQIKIVITKNTTLEELEKIKTQMKTEGFGFQYSKVNYNQDNEIISITIQYKDANNNSGQYSVSSKTPINNIVIVSEGNLISVKSEGSSNQVIINQGSGGQISPNNDQSYEDLRQEMKEKSDQMEKEMNERLQTMKDRHAQREAQMKARRDSISEQSSNEAFNRTPHIISKNTSDSELLELQKIFESENISFYYKDLQRNNKNEITHISITIDNKNGSISTSTFGNGNDTIKNISLVVDQQHTIMKSVD